LQRGATPLPAQSSWAIGQSWVRTLRLASSDSVVVGVISSKGVSSVLASATLVPGQVAGPQNCPFDVTPPTVGTWSVPDVTTVTVGQLTITAALVDDCFGVDPAIVPHLFYRINPGTNPAYIDTGVMTSIGSNQWSGAIPSTVWALKANQNLQYYLSPVADLKSPANAGTTQTNTDLIDLIQAFTYVTSHTDTTGSYTVAGPFANAQAVGGGNAVIQEASVGQTSALTLLANPTTSTASTGITAGLACVSSPASNCALQSDLKYARLDLGTDVLKVSGFVAPAGATGITQVVIGTDVARVAGDAGNPILHFTYSGGPSADPSTFLQTLTTVTPVNIERTLTGSWTTANIGTLVLQIDAASGGSIQAGKQLDVDRLYVKVIYTFNGFATDMRMDWTGVPTGTVQALDMGGCSVTVDTYNVLVWDWTASAYNNRGTISGGTCPTFTYTLTATEYQAGNVRVRFTDVTPASAQGTLTMDYARVDTT